MQRGLVGSEMCIRDRYQRRVHGTMEQVYKIEEMMQKEMFDGALPPTTDEAAFQLRRRLMEEQEVKEWAIREEEIKSCLLYTSDAADDTPCVDLGGRRIIKKKKKKNTR
eukprot:TRINITY_DN2258_c0_g1_i3.p2 TRINITY_DN2258_c0_g1~~TRINITY_DN2258_c0_g1_i3.p2  ORF type:complete len:109 (+),score=53.83 TRINITY_DN2258_c0_g1_i3:152-478(+)